MKINILFTIMLALFGLSLNAQITFEKTFSVISSDYGESVQQTNDSGYIITGYSSSGNEAVILLKTDAYGNKQWDKNLGEDEAYSVLQTADSGYIIAGRVWNGGILDILLIKTDINGDTIWRKTYGTINSDDAWSIYHTNDNGFIIGGRSNNSGSNKMYIIKIDANGNQLWSNSFGGGSSDNVYGVQQTNDGGYMLAGIATIGGNSYNLIKTDSAGNLLWYNTQGGGYGANSGYQLSDGGYILTISQESGANLIRTDNSGNIIWNKFYSCGGYCSLSSVQQTTDSGLIAVGSSASSFFDPRDVFLIKTNTSGDSIWAKKFGGSANEQGREVKETSDGGYILVGKSGGNVYLIKTNGNGCVSSFLSQNPTICNGQSITVGSNIYTMNGTYFDTLMAANGCDSVVTTNLIANSNYAVAIDTTINNGDSIQVGNSIYKATGTYIDTLITSNGCDSIITTNLTVLTGIRTISYQNTKVEVYPNPFTTSVTIQQQTKIENSYLTIYNIFSQTVKSINVTSDKTIIERGDLISGIYFYKLAKGTTTISSGKLIVTD